MSQSRLLLALLSVGVIACSSDKPTGPRDPLATRLNEIADSSADSDYRTATALYAAAAMVQAGGAVSTVDIVVDSEPRRFSAVALRVTYSRAVCQQLRDMFRDFTSDSGSTDLFPSYDPCQPIQSVVAWEGERMARIVFVQGDTGVSATDSLTYDYNFWGEVYDREARTQWWLQSGTQTSRLSADRGACRTRSIPEQGIDFNCRLVTLRHSFDLVLEEYPIFDFPIDSLTRELGRLPGDSTYGDTSWVDSGYVWEPGPTHTVAMRTAALNGLAMEITRLDLDMGMGLAMQSSLPRPARFRHARRR